MWTLSQKKYASSEKGILARKKFQQSEKGVALRIKYLAQRKAKRLEIKDQKNSVTPIHKTIETSVENTKNIIK